VRQAHAETHVIQETKKYMLENGINLEAFSDRERDDRIILIKNFPFGTTPDELRTLLSEYGQLNQLLMPPTGTIAIAEFQSAPSARASFAALAYRRFKEGILFLEKGPKGLFSGRKATDLSTHLPDIGKDAKVSGGDLKDLAPVEPGTEDVTTLFVRNISFSTSSDGFTLAFRPLDGFLWAKIKTRPDAKNPSRTLSMGFGFVGFQTPSQARTALGVMDGYTLDGHKLSVKIAHKGTDAASERKSADAKKNAAMKQTKIIIKNLPFEATKKDVRSLFGYVFGLNSLWFVR
jgi:multiple RNA-binding domain-containing protein 1